MVKKHDQEEPKKVEDVSNEPKAANEILEEQIKTGLKEHQRSNQGLLVSSFAAGLEIGFTLFLSGILYTIFNGEISKNAMHLVLAFSYPIGFIFVIIGRSELFTEHTTLAVIPVLRGTASFRSLIVLWGVILLGNLLGGYLMAYLLTSMGPKMGIITASTFSDLAHKMIDFTVVTMFLSSVLAGWLMGLLSWLVTSAQETISRIVIVIFVTSLIGLGGLHHAIVGSVEVFAGVLTSSITAMDYIRFQSVTTIGNIVGGVVFVSIIKFSLIKLSEEGNK